MMRIAVASDHAGFELKKQIVRFLGNSGYTVSDFGPASADAVDYPDTIAPAARAVAGGEADRAIVICGSGIGASIVANKIHGIRAALCHDLYDAEYSRRHNDANVLALGARRLQEEKATELLVKWLSTTFEGDRHARRLEKIARLEDEENARGAR